MGYSFTFKDKELDFKDDNWISYWDIMLTEFFKASKEDKDKFRKAYIAEYGVGPYNYMMQKFWYSWERGDRTLSDTQSYRIRCLMPDIISEEVLHRIGVNEFVMSIKDTIKEFFKNQKGRIRNAAKLITNPKEVSIYERHKTLSQDFLDKSEGRHQYLIQLKNPQDLVNLFEQEFEKIKSLTLKDFRVYVLKYEDKKEALEISKYILETKLQKSFDQIERDFNVFLPYMLSFNRGIFTASYLISAFDIKIDITRMELNDITFPKFKIREILVNSNYKSYADKYLADELVTIHSQFQKAVSKSFLNANDIKMFFDHYQEISLGDSEVNMNSTFQGEGGILTIQAEMKPLKMIRASLLISIIKLSAYSILLIGLISAAINYKLIPLLIFAGIYLIGLFYALYKEEIKQLKSLRIQIKQYGK